VKRFMLITTAALALGAFTVFGQPAMAGQEPGQTQGQHQQRHMGMRMKGLAKKLNLTDAQKAQIKSIMKEQRPKVRAIRQDNSLTPEQKKAKLQALRKETQEKIAAILTPEQKEKMKELRQQHGRRHGHKNAAGNNTESSQARP